MDRGPKQLHEEKELLASLAQGDRQAFGVLYHCYAQELLTKAYRKTGVLEVAEDLVQDLFAGLWSRREQLDVQGSVGAYLHGILDHKVIDYYRQVCSRLKHLDRLIELFDQPQWTPADRLAFKEQESDLRACISDLPKRMQDVFVLSRFEQMSTDEISEKLSLSHQTIRNQISRALKIVRSKMASLPGIF